MIQITQIASLPLLILSCSFIQAESDYISENLFVLPEGLEVKLWAHSPMLQNPTNIDVDQHGRIWVAEGVNYRRARETRKEGDRIVILEDTDLDGVADKSSVFVQDTDLEAPLGVSVFDNKVIVPQPPNLIIYTDVNRDLKFDPKVDKKEILLTGFNASQHDHSLHSLTAGPDGKWYFNVGNCGAIFNDQSGKTFNLNGSYRGGRGPGVTYFADNHKLDGKPSGDGFVWTAGATIRMNPDASEAEIVGHGYRNSYEQSVTSYGDIFQNDNDDTQSCRNSYVLEYGSAGFFSRFGQSTWRTERRPGQIIPQAHWRQDDPGTFDAGDIYGLGSPTGNVFYENGALGEDYIGSYFAADAARNTIFSYKPVAKGAGYDLSNRSHLVSTKLTNGFGGTDGTVKYKSIKEVPDEGVLFRPSDLLVGVDGAIYLSDWYDGRVGGHGTVDKKGSGAIYRIAPVGFKPSIPKFDLSTIDGQIEVLKSPAVNVRYSGFKALKKQGASALPAVERLLNHPNKYIAARAIWLLPHLGEQGIKKVESLLDHTNEEVRLVAYRSLKRSGKNILPYATKLAGDDSSAVRRDVALSLRHYTAAETKDIFLKVTLLYDGHDKNYLESIGLGAENKENDIWQHLKLNMASDDNESWSDKFTKVTWRLWPTSAIDSLTQRALSTQLSQEQRSFAVESLAFIYDKKSADAILKIYKTTDEKTKETAAYWLKTRAFGMWQKMGLRPILKKEGIYDPDKIVVHEAQLPIPDKKPLASTVTDIEALNGDSEKGKALMATCAACHKVNEIGVNYGPLLKGWGSTQSKTAIINSIVNPSADIAHGYKGEEIELKDGKIIHGLVNGSNPVIVTSIGGLTQTVPKDKIKK